MMITIILISNMFPFLGRSVKISIVNMFEEKGLVPFLLTLVPVSITGHKRIRFHFGNLHKLNTIWEIDWIKECVRILCDEGPRNRCPVIVRCMA
jgi:hypothetical protein